jgi:hypothetical protein
MPYENLDLAQPWEGFKIESAALKTKLASRRIKSG